LRYVEICIDDDDDDDEKAALVREFFAKRRATATPTRFLVCIVGSSPRINVVRLLAKF
jgi:hypothetical protein